MLCSPTDLQQHFYAGIIPSNMKALADAMSEEAILALGER